MKSTFLTVVAMSLLAASGQAYHIVALDPGWTNATVTWTNSGTLNSRTSRSLSLTRLTSKTFSLAGDLEGAKRVPFPVSQNPAVESNGHWTWITSMPVKVEWVPDFPGDVPPGAGQTTCNFDFNRTKQAIANLYANTGTGSVNVTTTQLVPFLCDYTIVNGVANPGSSQSFYSNSQSSALGGSGAINIQFSLVNGHWIGTGTYVFSGSWDIFSTRSNNMTAYFDDGGLSVSFNGTITLTTCAGVTVQ